jgi:adenylate cyclase
VAREQRRLAAVMAADIAGYSRLMGRDESGTLASVKALRAGLIDPVIAEHGGRIVKTTGDGLLMEFPSIVDAVRCAVAVQTDVEKRNADQAPDGRIRLRVGLNVGDIIIDGDDIFGDGVNIAARLESLAQPGGLCLSQAAYDVIHGKIDLALADGGSQSLRNIDQPVHVWHWCVAGADGAAPVAVPPGHDKPSLAVLAFDNMSGDREQEYFADGIAEDIITELSRFRSFHLIARNSSFLYRGRTVDLRQVGRELGAHYVLEGSVRRGGNRVRINVQLVDASDGTHVWAERYDSSLEDIFAVQDEVTRRIVAVLPGRIEAAVLDHAKRKTSGSLEAYDWLLRGKYHHHLENAEANAEAERCFDRSLELDPGFAAGVAWKCCTLGQAYSQEFREREPALWAEIERLSEQALRMDPSDAECHRMTCRIALQQREYARSERHLARALDLTPNDPRLIVQRGINLTLLGEPEAAIPWIEQAMKLDPFSPERYYLVLARALFTADRRAEALAVLDANKCKHHDHYIWLAACKAVSEPEEARAAAQQALGLRPGLTVSGISSRQPWRRRQDTAHFEEALKAAGFPT